VESIVVQYRQDQIAVFWNRVEDEMPHCRGLWLKSSPAEQTRTKTALFAAKLTRPGSDATRTALSLVALKWRGLFSCAAILGDFSLNQRWKGRLSGTPSPDTLAAQS
jgi:hypothetical protein